VSYFISVTYSTVFLYFRPRLDVNLLYIHSFPTRRSSDLARLDALRIRPDGAGRAIGGDDFLLSHPRVPPQANSAAMRRRVLSHRSEEHTSELQSRENLVCRLLIEKKHNI